MFAKYVFNLHTELHFNLYFKIKISYVKIFSGKIYYLPENITM